MTKNKILTYRMVIIVVSIFAVGTLVAGAANFSFLDRIAQVAGQILAGNIMQKVDLNDMDNLGAMSGPVSPWNYMDFGGVQHYYGTQDITQATTTICRLQAPTATSTLIYASVSFVVSSSTATAVEMARSTDALSYATTTTLFSAPYLLTANANRTINASTTLMATTVFSSGDWLVVKMDNGTGGSANVPEGQCKAEWIVNDN